MNIGIFSDTLYEKELDIERESLQLGVAKYNRMVKSTVKRGAGAALAPCQQLLVHWYDLFRHSISAEKAACTVGRPGLGRRLYGPYLHMLPSDKLAIIAMHTILGECLLDPEGPTIAKLVLAVGRKCAAEVNLDRLRKRGGEAWYALTQTDRRQIMAKGVAKIVKQYVPEYHWELKVQTHIGACLLRLLLDVATVDPLGRGHEFVPAFDKIRKHKYGSPRVANGLRLSKPAHKLLSREHDYRQHLHPQYMPMVVAPLLWSDENMGGYLKHPISLTKSHRRHVNHGVSNHVRDAVNALNGVPWRVNRKMLAVVQKLWDTGGAIAGIPRADELSKPDLPPDFETNADSKRGWKHQAAIIRRHNVMHKGERVVFAYKLKIAEQFKDYGRIFFPHQLDFRGRAYSVPVFLNHQGDDVCRGLLEFAEPRDIGPDGARWLKIHVANCCGITGVSFEDREQWVDDNIPRFERWISDPLGNLDWAEMDNPFQALAAVYAMADDKTAVHLPLQIDGSNNAFQHYGAMLRCQRTGVLTNLVPFDSPASLYNEIAAQCALLVSREAEKGDKRALKLEGWINRKVVKQTVMTTAYKVTSIGARRQIYAQLEKAGFDGDYLYSVSQYLSKLVMNAVAQTCPSVYNAMLWLADSARKIAKSGEVVCWTTPGQAMTVEQPYRRADTDEVRTMLQCISVNRMSHDSPVHVKRQTNGMAANFVHSLDAEHMMRTALVAIKERDLCFAAVHDSYWTHAADMEEMSQILRTEFLKLHATPLLTVLCDELQARYPSVEFDAPPETGTLNLNDMLGSKYFFS